MAVTREMQKAEAIKRMKMLKVIPEAIKQFEKEDLVNCSEGGALYWLDDEQKEMVAEFEQEYNGLVYMVIHDRTEFGELYNMLYVSKHKDEWEYDNEDLKDGYAYAYVKNVTCDDFSEIGSIAIANRWGGLVRIG